MAKRCRAPFFPGPRQPLFWLALAATLGIAAAEFADWPVAFWGSAAALFWTLALFLPSAPACWCSVLLAFAALHTLAHRDAASEKVRAEISSGPRAAEVQGIVRTEPQPAKIPSRIPLAQFRLQAETISLASGADFGPVALTVLWAGPAPKYGDRVRVFGTLENIAPPRNPGQFDAQAYSARQGIAGIVRARFSSDCQILGEHEGWKIQAWAYRSAHWIQSQLTLGLEDSPEISGLMTSMVLGLQSDTPEDLKSVFQRTGTMHLFAVSGLNVAMLAGILCALFRVARLGRNAAIGAVLPLLAGYALVTGLSASCVRATVMMAVLLLGLACDRRPLALNTLGAAALLILAFDTEQLFLPGFQFSFVLVFVLVCLSGRLQRWIAPLGQPDPWLPRELWTTGQRAQSILAASAAGTLAVTLSAWLGSLLFTAGYFHLFSLASILANLFAVPLSFGVLALALATLLCTGVWTGGAVLCNNANWLCAKTLLAGLRFCALFPGGHQYVELPSFSAAPRTEITVLDVGEGGAVHVRVGASDWLLDCGSTGHYDRVVLPYLRSRGVNTLDGLLLTHGDSQHLGGAISALTDFFPRSIVESPVQDRSSIRRRFHAELARALRGKNLSARGDIIALTPAARLVVLYPPAGILRRNADDTALVVRLELPGFRALFTSDSGFFTEQWLLENEPDLASDILIKGQHSKDLSGTPDFLRRVHPQAVICTGLGVTSPVEPLDLWETETRALGMAVFRQDHTGAVRIRETDGAFVIDSFFSRQTFRSRTR